MFRTRAELKGFFKKNLIPTQSNFEDFIDSGLNQNDDGLVKLPNDPLTISATGPEEALLRFSRVDNTGSKPAWLVKQKPVGAAASAGLAFQDAAAATGAATPLFLQSGSGNVGIGTLTPGARLDVAGSGGTTVDLNVNGRLRSNSDDGGLWISTDRFVGGFAGKLGVYHGGGWRLTVQSDGNVGIGTPTPAAKLEVAGAVKMRVDAPAALGPILTLANQAGLAGAGGAVDFNGCDPGSNDPSARIQSLDNGSYSSHLSFLTKNSGASNNRLTERLRIQAGGNVGIGTSNPPGRLTITEQTGTVSTPDAGTLVFEHEDNGGASSIVFRSKVNRSNDYGYIQYQDSAVVGGAGESCRLIIGIQNDGDDHVILLPSGGVGIGTNNPGAKLEVVGGGGATIDLLVNGRLKSNNNDGGLWISNDRFIGGFDTNKVGFWNAAGGWQVALAGNGNVGMGTTAPQTKLHVIGDAIITGNLTIGSWTLVGSGDRLYLKNGGSTVAMFSSNGDHLQIFKNADGRPPYFFYNNGNNFGTWG